MFASLAMTALVGGCASDNDQNSVDSVEQSLEVAAAPAGLKTVTTASGSQLTFYPYTLENFGAQPSDPINLVFSGAGANPRRVRQALFNLAGDRTGTPFALLTNCTWADAMGANQVTYGNDRWTGSAVQLECGNYEGPFRFHLRMFQLGNATLANAHFEILIPGTTQHQVLSWELAEQFVTVELQRAGLLTAAPTVLPAMNQGPTFRTIPAPIYLGLPDQLIAVIGGPAKAQVTGDVGIKNDGHTMSFDIATQTPIVDGPGRTRDLNLSFNQAVPRPFCNAGPLDYVMAQSPAGQPIVFHQRVEVQYGLYNSEWSAEGPLYVTPLNVTVSPPAPSGPTQFANVYERHAGHSGPLSSSVETDRSQEASATPDGAAVTSLDEHLRVGVLGFTQYSYEPVCK